MPYNKPSTPLGNTMRNPNFLPLQDLENTICAIESHCHTILKKARAKEVLRNDELMHRYLCAIEKGVNNLLILKEVRYNRFKIESNKSKHFKV